MDSERRHELETNDLREFLDNFKDFWNKNGNFLLIFLIVVVGGWLGYTKYNQWQADKAESAYTELNSADSADAFRQVAGEHAKVHDEAMRRGADTALGEARTALIANEKKPAKTELKKAHAAYTALVERGATTEYQLVGHEGLAKVAVMRVAVAEDQAASEKQWAAAASHYEKAIALAGETFVNQADRAQRALDRLDLLKNPIAFAPPEAASTITPTPSPASDANEPLGPVPALPPLPAPE